MGTLVLNPTSTAQWHALVQEAESKSRQSLGEEVQSYLVILLQRFLSKPEIAGRILALDYLKGLRTAGRNQFNELRDVGDICLLHAGFYPKRARRRRVSISYYVDLGISAYYQVHHHTAHRQGELFAHLYESFVPAMDVLQAIHRLNQNPPLLDALAAHELWETTDSSEAREHLSSISGGAPVAAKSTLKH